MKAGPVKIRIPRACLARSNSRNQRSHQTLKCIEAGNLLCSKGSSRLNRVHVARQRSWYTEIKRSAR